LADLTLREKVGQLTNVWIPGAYVSTNSAEFDTLAAWVEEEGLGGVTISMGLPHSYVAKLNALQERAKVPLLVAADMEAGPGTRINNIYSIPHLLPQGGGTVFPPLMGFGAIGDEHYVSELGRITGVEARAVGVHLAWVPVLDVNSNPENPIINTRSFGEDPEVVGRLGSAYIAGAHAAGLQTTAKHFPGHGDTREDSHIDLPVLDVSRARLDSLELVPFRHAVSAGVDAVMSAHVATPGILGPEGLPATLSPYFMTQVLREEMDFQGLVVTDALTMGAIRRHYTLGEAAVLSVEAGADVVLYPPDLHVAIEAITEAVESGRISEERIDSSVRRILEAKARAGLYRERLVPLEAVDEIVGSRPHLGFAESAAARSITLPRDHSEIVPLGARVGRVLSVAYARHDDVIAGGIFDRTLARRIRVVDAGRVESRSSADEYEQLRARADSADVVVVSAYVPPQENVGTVGVPERFASFVAEVARSGKPLVVVSFGNPYLLTDFPDVGTYLIAWGGVPLMQRAAAAALLGEAAIGGRLPISLPPFHRRGEGLERAAGLAPATAAGFDPAALARVDSVIEAAIADSATPGAALAVGRRGRLVRLRGYGRIDWSSPSRGGPGPGAPIAPAATDSTIWDIASLTKAVATTTAVMQLVAEGAIELDRPVAAYLPWFGAEGKEAITVRQLLLHRGGLPPFRPWWRAARHDAAGKAAPLGRGAYRDSLAALTLVATPGDSTIYSDLGFIALGFLVEEVAGEPLDAVARERIFAPLGMRETTFTPPAAQLPRIAPTEVDTFAGRGHVRGFVHDENAWAMGGVAGHAGVFASARDLARFAEALLDAARAAPDVPGAVPASLTGAPALPGAETALPVFDPAVVARFVARHDTTSSRALGWDTPSERSSAGRFLSERAFGHTGFTGTSIWIDPELDLFVVLLTNSVNPTRENSKHFALRRAVHEAVACAINDVSRPASCPVTLSSHE
jgi:beta-glucosidase-like glycosyl hydrolase/CubicO group peptidase (beta-lactamase class C family)